MGEMTENHDSPSRIAAGLSGPMIQALRTTTMDCGRYAARIAYGRTATLAALVSRGLLTPGRVHYLTDLGRRVAYAAGIDVMLIDDLHAEAIAECPIPVQTSAAGSGWQNIDNRGGIRHGATGIEVRPMLGTSQWEIFIPELHNGRRLMMARHAVGGRLRAIVLVRNVLAADMRQQIEWAYAEALDEDRERTGSWGTFQLPESGHRKIEAAAARNRAALVSGDTVPGFRRGKIPLGWTPEHSAKLASEIRSKVLTAQAMAEPGSLKAAAEIVDKVTKQAMVHALRQVKTGIEEWRGRMQDPDDKVFKAYASVFEMLLADAARELGVDWP